MNASYKAFRVVPSRNIRGSVQLADLSQLPSPTGWVATMKKVLTRPTGGWARDTVQEVKDGLMLAFLFLMSGLACKYIYLTIDELNSLTHVWIHDLQIWLKSLKHFVG